MCIMFRDKWSILFFKFPFCGDFSLLLLKMVQETSRKLKIYKGMFFETSITIWYIVLAEWAKTQNCDNKIMYKFSVLKTLAGDRPYSHSKSSLNKA